jgi:hypothetical protein
LWKGKGHTWWIFFREENQHVPINTRCTRRVDNHHLRQFLTFLEHERGFVDATIVNRERSLKPFSQVRFSFYWLLWGRRETSALVDWAIIG